MVNLLILLALAAGCRADGGIAYRGPPPVKEVFHLNDDVTYYLYSEKVSWDEARAVCTADKGQLAVPDDSVKARFLAQSIGDAWAALEDMWIGGQMVQNVWEWAGPVPKKLPETSRQATNMTFLYPPWVDGAMPNRRGRECMAIDRNGHSDPYFIDLECKLLRPFICETVTKNGLSDPSAKRSIKIYDYEYILYHGRVSWDGAVAFCRSQGYVLASVYNSSYADKLAKAMLKTRPEFEDVWIGGSFKNDKWIWVENSEEIPPDSTPSGENGVLFPPWAHNPPQSSPDYCILFDRHLCETPTFIDIKCNRLRDFVCAKSIETSIEPAIVDETTTVRRKKYVIHHTPATFDEARAICEDDKNANGEGKLLYIDGGETQDPYDELSVLMQIMSDNKDQLIHVWLAATYDETIKAFKWLYDVPNFQLEMEENKQVLATEANEATGYPPWCNNDEQSVEMPCLNLDRQNYNTPLFYGLECNVTQSVICVVEATPKGVERFHVNGRGYQTSEPARTDRLSSWTHASKFCEEDTGSMLTDVDEGEMNEIVAKLPDGDYFISGRFSGSKHTPMWVPSHNPIELGGVEIQPYESGKNCLVMTVAGGAIASVHGFACDEKCGNNFVCADKCSDEVDEIKDHSWHCNWHEGQAVTEAVIGKACDKRCPVNQVMIGSKKLTCQANGWVGSRLGQAAHCLETAEAASQLTDLIINSTDDSGVLFIYDGSRELSSEELQVMQYLIASTVTKLHEPAPHERRRRYIGNHRNRRSKSKSRSKSRSRRDTEPAMVVPLINLNDANEEPIVLDGSDQCEMVGKLGHTVFTVGEGKRDYAHAFYKAKHQLDTFDKPYSVVVISGGPNQGDDYREQLHALKSIAKSVITLGVGNKCNYEELADIATANHDRVLQYAAVADYKVFKNLGDGIADPNKCAEEIEPLKTRAEEAVQKLALDAEEKPGAEPPHDDLGGDDNYLPSAPDKQQIYGRSKEGSITLEDNVTEETVDDGSEHGGDTPPPDSSEEDTHPPDDTSEEDTPSPEDQPSEEESSTDAPPGEEESSTDASVDDANTEDKPEPEPEEK